MHESGPLFGAELCHDGKCLGGEGEVSVPRFFLLTMRGEIFCSLVRLQRRTVE